ncbi:NAD(+) diphosphatase [Thalassomonas viridans]|uniref:NAD(+) diphosphatase n=1 Tax=Thalassomonas viridans TaxID=137584 RepID=A0AAE9Z656_9GAMM|nr:NAD(+) diphosphatase [Thalassomonas viridans]WDE06804.1 NAD(+) diphosphatase [Thalassomonas viridans]
MSSPALTFSQMSLNRASSARKNETWLQEQQNRADTVFLPVWRSLCLFTQEQLAWLTRELEITRQLIAQASNCYFLGLDGEQAVFVLDLSDLSQQNLEAMLGDKYQLKDFRISLPLVTPKQAPVLAYGRALNHWHRQCLHCGYCGEKTLSLDGGHRRKCQSESCAKEHFPRTDPVVIMLVEHQAPGEKARCLLAQHHNIPAKVVSTLAGFVDPGESLEEAVCREVQEEAGVAVEQVTYMASQPWPFPNSLMIGFFARAKNDKLNIDNDEIADAKWFSAEEISTFDNWGDEGDNYKLPRKESIARYLIDTWLAQQQKQQT